MHVAFDDDDLETLYFEAGFSKGYSAALVTAYRKRMQSIIAACDERDLRNQVSLHFKKLDGKRQHQYSLRLNDQYRLIIELESVGQEKRVRIKGIEDYH